MEVVTLKSHKILFFVSVNECYKCFTLTLGEVTCTVTCYSCVPGHLPWGVCLLCNCKVRYPQNKNILFKSFKLKVLSLDIKYMMLFGVTVRMS